MTTYFCGGCGSEEFGCTIIVSCGWDFPDQCPFRSMKDHKPDFHIVDDLEPQ
jgi:hypothetical protein